MKKKILFLCTGNAARSQMAEGLARANHDDKIEVVSAGSRPAGFVHPNAIRALSEIGIDIHDAQSKSADEFLTQRRVDYFMGKRGRASNWVGETI